MSDEWEAQQAAGLRALEEGDFARAVTRLRSALSLAESFGERDARLGTTLHHLARAARGRNDYADAEAFGRRALKLREEVLGREDPDVARTLQNLAVLYALQERFDEAEPLFQRAIDILRRAMGPAHPEVATARKNYGRMQDARDRSTIATGPPLADVLVVEDDVSARALVLRKLQSAGYTVATAVNGRRAMEYLRTHEPPGLILLDMVMPDMNGWEFRVELGKHPGLARVPIVILSGINNVEDHADLLKADGYLTKPVDPELLLDTVARFLD